ncbi:MAG TPA: type II secretion system protein [Planctomycetota bacterium]|nr:type II secretion system protein [Planctomycetota bacterium]
MWTKRLAHPPLRPRARGFTLVELLASMGIIVFVLSIAILAIGPALRAAGTKDGARRLRAALDAARVKAIQQRRAVRFEAQQASDGGNFKVPEQWGVTPNAGDPTYEWHALPEFVTVDIKAGSGSWQTDATAFTITFGADATVVAASVNGTALSPTDLLSAITIRLWTLREAPNDEVNKGACFIEITPITGVFTSYGYEEYQEDGTGKVKAADLPKS